jgi:hypothetical protein
MSVYSVYVCLPACFRVRFLSQMMDIHRLRCGHCDVRKDIIIDLSSVQSVRTCQ